MLWFDIDMAMLEVLNWYHVFMLLFALTIMSSYIILGSISIFSLRRYIKENSFVNYQMILNSEMAPRLSLIAPAYNEGLTIEANVQSLLSLNYNNFEVIVVNDG
ncbi:MAG TPA: glycosyltransferase family 2 protein, partial [Gillisia sp.]|nr:glycosyltransferase family 2 protein [Gillisia sp.]